MGVVAQGDREISDCCRTCQGPGIRGSVMATARSDRVTVVRADGGAGAKPIRTAKQATKAALTGFWSGEGRDTTRRCPTLAGSGPGMDQEGTKDQIVTSNHPHDGLRVTLRE